MENKPIKRNEHIQELSKDHHFGLLFSWKIKEGLKKNIEMERLKSYLNFFWSGHLKSHFLDEEVLLFNRVEDSLCEKAKKEHQHLIAQVNKINEARIPEVDDFRCFIEMLNEHIRFEERVLFPYLETVLSPAALSAIGDFLAKDKNNTFKDNFKDEFWVTKY